MPAPPGSTVKASQHLGVTSKKGLGEGKVWKAEAKMWRRKGHLQGQGMAEREEHVVKRTEVRWREG